MWKLRIGSAWRDVPERYGSWQTLCTHFRRWAPDGTFSRMLQQVRAEKDAVGDIDWFVSVDSTVVRAHQHAAGGKRGSPRGRNGRSRPRPIPQRTEHQGPPRLRRAGPPARLRPDRRHTNDCTRFEQVLESIRAHLRRHGIRHTIPEHADQVLGRLNRGRRGGRPPVFDRAAYHLRNVVERCFNRLKQWHGLATRYDKTRESYQAAITIASLLLWI